MTNRPMTTPRHPFAATSGSAASNASAATATPPPKVIPPRPQPAVPSADPWPQRQTEPSEPVVLADPPQTPQPPHFEPPARSSIDPSPVAEPVVAEEPQPLRPAWLVDVFDVPSAVSELFFAANVWDDVGGRFASAVRGGLRSMLVTSTESGEGRSTTAIGLGLAIAAQGLKVALVDVDSSSPSLADDLRLDLEFGWVEALRGGLPIDEVAVHASEDQLTLVPQLPPTAAVASPTSAEVIQLLEMLDGRYDLLLLDGPAATNEAVYRLAPTVDSAVIVRDVTRVGGDAVNSLAYRLKESGVKGVGVVENFG